MMWSPVPSSCPRRLSEWGEGGHSHLPDKDSEAGRGAGVGERRVKPSGHVQGSCSDSCGHQALCPVRVGVAVEWQPVASPGWGPRT